MWHRNPNTHLTNKALRDKKNSLETKKRVLDCYVITVLFVWQWMPDNLPTDEEENGGNKNVILPKHTENLRDAAR